MAFTQSFFNELVERADIVDVVSDYVQLKQKGANLFGLCPFHSEKSPSFSVNRDRQIFHCFGCGVGGGVITFIKMAENLEFADAVRFLAARMGIEVQEEDTGDSSRRRARLIALNKEAARFFHEALNSNDAGAVSARSYLERRGMSERSIRRFGLGYAPDSWDSLLNGVKGYHREEFIDAGLAVRGKKDGAYDRFRNRVMFPIIDVRGNVVAFGGRVMDDSTPKYLNTSETPVFSKGRNLFAMNIARKSTRPYFILAEGYMDVIALHQAGFDCAVASLGTALTDAQARMMSQSKKQAVIAFDMDSAGRGAAERAINLLSAAGMEVKLLELNGAKDPDEFIQRFGADTLSVRLERSEGHIEYRLAGIRAKYDLDSDDGRVGYIREAAALVATLENRVEQAVYTAKIAREGNVDASVVEQEAESYAKESKKKQKNAERRAIMQPSAAIQPDIRGIRYDNVKSAAAEEAIVFYCHSDSEHMAYAAQSISADEFSSPVLSRAFAEMVKATEDGSTHIMTSLEAALQQDEMRHIGRVMMKDLPQTCSKGEFQAYINTVKEQNTLKNTDDLTEIWQHIRQKKGLD